MLYAFVQHIIKRLKQR